VRSTSGPGDDESMYTHTHIEPRLDSPFSALIFVDVDLESNIPDSLPRDEEAFASNHSPRDILVVVEITI
jgi:hypothetical protein